MSKVDDNDFPDYDGIYHFSRSLGIYRPIKDFSTMIHELADTLRARKFDDILDITFNSQTEEDVINPSFTIYYTLPESEEITDEK